MIGEQNLQDISGTLLREIQNGSDESFALLEKRYAPLIVSMVSSFCASGSGARDELLQEAQSALLKAALTYDCAQKDVSFGLYAKICIRNALISHRRKVLRRTHRDMPGKTVNEKKDVRRVFSQAEDMEQMLVKIEGLLSAYEKQVLRAYMAGKSVSEIAGEVGKGPKSVYNALFRIRQKGKQLEWPGK